MLVPHFATKAVWDATERDFDLVLNTNLKGPFFLTQAFVKHLQARKSGGKIINISSVVGVNPLPTASVYSATKAAVDAVTKALSKELGPKKIRVNSLNPGMVETEGVHTAGFLGTDFHKMIVAQTPLGRIAQPDDIAKVAVFLASDDSGWITGETLLVSGGMR